MLSCPMGILIWINGGFGGIINQLNSVKYTTEGHK